MKNLLTVLLACVWFCGYAQPNVTLGKPYAVIDAEGKYYFSKGNEIMSVKVDKKTITIQKYRADNLTFQKIKLYDDFPKNYVVEKVTRVQDRYYVFYSSYDGDNEQLFGREISFKDGQFTSPAVKLLTITGKITGNLTVSGFYNYEVRDKFTFFFSSDSSKMLIQYRLKPEIKSDNRNFDVIGMGVYDKTMKAQWVREVKMPYTEKKMNNMDYVVDKKGNAYIVALVYEDNTTELKDDEGNPNYSIEIMKVPPGNKELVKYPVALPNKFVRTLWIYENPKGYMLCAGFYNKGKDNLNADGILTFKMSEDGKTSDVATYEIPVDILNQYASERTQRKNERKEGKDKAEFEDLKLREILFDKDGSMLLVGEQNFIKRHRTYSSSGGSTVYYTYHYNDLLITKINTAGKMVWMKKLPKRQTGGNGQGGMSYTYIKGVKEHYFLFLDNAKNKDLSLDKLPAMHVDGQGGFLTAYKVNDTSGETAKMYVLDTRDIDGVAVYQFKPTRIVGTNAKEFVFEVYKKKKEDILIKVRM
jgi:hypothetical protein